MAALQCELCGGKLIGRPNGMFECDSCGMEYDTAWAKQKIQEIKGTVKVEGTVEVKGTVKVDGPVKVEGAASKENLVKLAKMKLENAFIGRGWSVAPDSDYHKIKSLLEQSLESDPEYAEAYLYLAVLKSAVHTVEEFRACYVKGQYECTDFKQFRRFAKGDLAVLAEEIQREYDAEASRLEADRLAKEAETKLAQQREDALFLQNRDVVLSRNTLARKHIAIVGSLTFWEAVAGLGVDGTVQVINRSRGSKWKEAEKWRNIIAIAGSDKELFGLSADGCCYLCAESYSTAIYTGKDATAISAGKDFAAILKADGGVYIYGNSSVQYRCEFWSGIAAIACSSQNVMALEKDGGARVAFTERRGSTLVPQWENVAGIGINPQGRDFFALLKDGTIREDREYNCMFHNESGKFYTMKDWKNIAAFQVLGTASVGWRADGSVVSYEFSLKKLEGIIALCKKSDLIIGITGNGTLRVLSKMEEEKDSWYSGVTDRELNEIISQWKLFESIETLEKERESAVARRAEQDRQEAAEEKRKTLREEKENLQAELAKLRGLFAGIQRKKMEARLAEIETELKKLN